MLLYDKSSILKSFNEARLDLFCMKNKNLESLPPIYLGCNVRQAYYQSSIWTTSHLPIQRVPTPEEWDGLTMLIVVGCPFG